MDTLKPKLELYKERKFSEKFSATFEFIGENFKSMLRPLAYILLPLSLIIGVSLDGYIGGTMALNASYEDAQLMGLIINAVIMMISFMLGTVVVAASVFAFMQIYEEREERLTGLTFADFKPVFLRNLKRVAISLLVLIFYYLIAIIIAAILSAVSLYTLIITIPAMFIVLVPLSLFTPIYAFEDTSVATATSKSISYGFKTWGGIFAIMFVVGIIANLIQSFTMVPMYIMMAAKTLLVLDSEGASAGAGSSIGMSLLSYILSIIAALGMLLSYVLLYIALAYQYGHTMEKMEGRSVSKGVDNFEEMADKNEDDDDLFAPRISRDEASI